ncbi:MAG: divalent-cation tolerance protein CutA [Candidatus Odinarchaeota archaeon]
MNYYIFLVTTPSREEGKNIATFLVESKLAACVNIIHNITSIYKWKGKMEEENEYLLVIKTVERNNERLIQKINEIHSYETPECIGFKIEKGSEKYLKWITEIVE